ncbi:Phytoene synthase (EC 2.5.1.32) [Mycetohabitans rhizoxinica HKI 454]|uniref:Phytoene synthase n=1 Tax=Mycetohabitans rhizoxinica (strain DSM 19002 / CIP 109453 / HKI 454) TaxID=882378 RepID=E5ARI1_MYCRK|nr:Phytoene synthase (EC 2.5.1.32) [Mycetohabitans rhizoxinica HKI 454]
MMLCARYTPRALLHVSLRVNIDDYCQQKAAPAGSSTYYALRQAPLTAQPLLTALYALHRELAESVSEVSDPAVGRAKLAWWQREFGALAQDAPTHPVTQAIARYYASTAPIEAFMTWLSGYQMDLDQARYLDFAGLRRYVEQVGAALASTVAGVTAREPTSLASWAPALGRALLLADIVERTGEDARRGRIYIPIDEMQRFGVTAADILHRRYGEGFTQLMSFQVERARRALTDALGAIPAVERRTQRVLRAQAAMSLALLRELEAEDYRVLHQRIALTPLRKLWIAWRTH